MAIFLATPLTYYLAMLPGLWDGPRLVLFLMVLTLAWEVFRAQERPAEYALPIAA